MTRPIKPLRSYQEHQRYPTAEERATELISRRGFLTKALAASAATAGAVAAGSSADAAPAKRDSRQQVSVYLDRWKRIGNSGLSAQRVVIFTSDRALSRFASSYKERSKLKDALMKVIRKAKGDDLLDGRKLYSLERKLGAALTKHYRKRTGKRIPQPDLMLVASRRYYRPRLRGRIRSPRYPHP